ncbi:MAG: hypothetical protein ACX931_05055 [Saccharospirillum sp.]
MRRLPAIIVTSLVLTACQPDSASTAPAPSVELEAETQGDVSLPLALDGVRLTEDTPGPVMMVLDTRLPPEASVQLRLNGTLVDQIDTGTQCEVLPAVTICQDDIARPWPTVLTSGGDYEIQLVASKAGLSRTLSAELSLPDNTCMESAELYQARLQPALQRLCGSCHTGANNAASVFSVNDGWDQMSNAMINRGKMFYQSPSGQNPGHSARPLPPWGEDYRLLAEMVWRAERDFQCEPDR